MAGRSGSGGDWNRLVDWLPTCRHGKKSDPHSSERDVQHGYKGAGKTPKRRRGLQGLLVGVLLLSFVLPAYLLLSSYSAQMRVAEDSTRNLVAMLRVQFNDALRRTEAKLDAMASKLSREAATQQALSECQLDIGVNHNHVNCADGEGRGTGLFFKSGFWRCGLFIGAHCSTSSEQCRERLFRSTS